MLASKALVVDGCRHVVRDARTVVSLERRPVLFMLARALGEAWPGDVRGTRSWRGHFGRSTPTNRIARGCGSRSGGFVAAAAPGRRRATPHGFALVPRRAREVVVLAPPVEERTRRSLLFSPKNGKSWSSSALALALGASQRTVQRALDALATAGKVQALWSRTRAALDEPARPGIPDNLVTPSATAEWLVCRSRRTPRWTLG